MTATLGDKTRVSIGAEPTGVRGTFAAPAAVPAGLDENAARADGQHCGRCGQPIAPGQDARRRASGTWVHESCPDVTADAR